MNKEELLKRSEELLADSRTIVNISRWWVECTRKFLDERGYSTRHEASYPFCNAGTDGEPLASGESLSPLWRELTARRGQGSEMPSMRPGYSYEIRAELEADPTR